jgi:cell division protein ZapA
MNRPGMKQIEVAIMGQSYLLGCPEGGEERLKEAVARVDKEMCGIRDAGKLRARERIAVLSALNLAFELAGTQAQAAAAPAREASRASDAPTSTEQAEHIDQLIGRLDAALNGDGHLL